MGFFIFRGVICGGSALESGCMNDQITINFQNPVPVFPLPGSVLLPHTPLPLHIFEERYKQMVNDVLDSHGLIAMGLFDGEVDEQKYLHGQPPLRPCVCVGYTIQHERLSDGRYLVLMQGLCRARIVFELDHEPYRLVQLEPTELPPMEDAELTDERATLKHFMANPLLREHSDLEDIARLIDEPVPTAALIDVGIGGLTDDPEMRYTMLTETDPRIRAAFLESELLKLEKSLSDEQWS